MHRMHIIPGNFLKSLNIYSKVNGIVVSYDDSSDENILKNTKALFLMRQINKIIR